MTKYELINLLKDCSIAFHTPVLLINGRNKLVYHFPDSFQKPPKVFRELHTSYIEESKKHPYTIQMFTDHYDQHLFLYPIIDQQGMEQIIGIGPFLQQEVSSHDIKRNLMMSEVAASLEQPLLEYFEQLPVLNQVQINALKRLLKIILPQRESIKQNALEQEDVRRHYQEYTQSLHSYSDIVASKQKFLDLFKRGDEASIEEYQLHRQKMTVNSDLRTHKNQLIRLVTELGHICTDKGAPHQEMDSLCDFYVNFLESKNDLEDLYRLELNILQSFLDRIRKIDDRPENSPLVERAQKYIFQNLTDHLTLKGIAETLNVNPNYLSGVFAKEKGISITHFINQQRIKEAKELLCITHHSLMDISILLGYNSQSYFTRVFKSIEGIGPKEFRQTYRVKED